MPRSARALALAIALCSWGLAPDAGAEDPPPSPGPAPQPEPAPDRSAAFFAEFDANKDGSVSREELAGVPDSVFALLDRNGDGRIEAGEVGRARGARRPAGRAGDPPAPPEATAPVSAEERLARLKEAFDRRDLNKDGLLDGAETTDRMRQGVDADKDGKVTFEEYSAMLERVRSRPVDPAAPPQAPTTPAAPQAPRTPSSPGASPVVLPTPEEVTGWDGDADGRLSRAEWQGSQEAWLKLDGDRDGWVTLDEVRGARAKAAAPSAHKGPVNTGEAAPDFTLTGHDGAARTLSAHAGQVVVLEWISYDCPSVRPHYDSGRMQALQKKWCERGVIWYAVCSSGPGKSGYRTQAEHQRMHGEWGLAAQAVLMDPDGAVGRAYGARTTPHVFVIDGSGRLAYDGAPDDRGGKGRTEGATAREYLDEALDAVTQGQAPTTPRVPSYG